VRFDWAYFTAKGEPSADLVTELADVDAAIAFAKKEPNVGKTLLAGKSLGSLVALRWSNAHPATLAGLALLTFPATNPEKPGGPRPGAEDLAKSEIGPLVLCGDRDVLAELPVLYGLAAKCPKPPQVVIVPGDHGLGTGTKGDPLQDENVGLAVQHVVVWAKRRVGL